jgi:nucleotide-binding universal stress UspA family protein
MFRSVIVPLDGTPAAAHALPYLSLIAAPGARVTLVGVVTLPLDLPSPPSQEMEAVAQMERASAFLWQDLDQRAQPLRAQGFHVVTTVRTGDITEEILVAARDAGADVIVLATLGTSGLARWMLGSIARQLLYRATLPILLIRAQAELDRSEPAITGVTVPLNGSSLAEASLPIAEEIAAHLDVPLEIVRIVPNEALPRQQPSHMIDTSSLHRLNVELAQTWNAAQEYVASIVASCATKGLPATGTVHAGDPGASLSNSFAQQPNALIVIATHGAGGSDSWTFGSVAEKLVTTVPNPILIVRPLAGKTGHMRYDPALAARYPD